MLRTRTLFLTLIAMTAFAANSLLCRYALSYSGTDPASFTSVRILAGAAILWLIMRLQTSYRGMQGNWRSALALFAYAAAFSFAYVSLPAATGALLLFGSVQATMIGYGLLRGERLRGLRLGGFLVALAGLLALLLPGVSAPPLFGSVLMAGSGVAWAIYSLRGKGASDPTAVTAGNFCRAACFAVGLSIIMLPWSSVDALGLGYAVLSGAIASGIGYIIWYMALSGLNSMEAATVQLSVPVIAGAGGILILAEPLSLRLVLCAIAVLSGVALVIVRK